MAKTAEDLLIRIDATTEQLRRELKRADQSVVSTERTINQHLSKMNKGFVSLGAAAKGAFAAFAVGAGIRDIIQKTDAQQKAVAKLNNALKQTGNVVGLSSKQLQEYASEMQRTTRLGDEQVIELENQLLAFTNVTGDQFKRTIKVITDFAEVTGRDAGSAVRTLAVAVNDPINGLSRLRQAGISLTNEQQDQIKALAKSGHMIEAQKLLLNALEKAYGGAAEAAANTFGGSLEQLHNAFNDLLEQKGGMPGATREIKALTAVLQDPQTKKAFDDLTSSVIKLIGVMAKATTGFVHMSQGLGILLAKAIEGPDDLKGITDRINEIKQSIDSLQKHPPRNAIALPGYKKQLQDLNAELENLSRKRDLLSGKLDTELVKARKRAHPLVPISITAKKKTGPVVDPYAGIGGFSKASDYTDFLNSRIPLRSTTGIQQSFDQNSQILGQAQQAQSQLDTLHGYADTPLQALERDYEQRLQLLDQYHQSEFAKEEEYQKLKTKLEKKYAEDRRKEIASERALSLQNFETLFNGLAGIAEAAGGRESKAFKALFAIEKAFTIARAAVAIQGGIAQAANAPWPANLAAMATVAANTGTIISTIEGIKAPNIQGQAHAGMTNIPSEGTYLLDKGERVVAASQNRDLMKFMAANDAHQKVVINNYTSEKAQTIQHSDGTVEVLIGQVKRSIESDIARGVGLARTMQRTYPTLERAGKS